MAINEHQELMRNHSIEKWIDVVAKDKTNLEKSLMYGDIKLLIDGTCPQTYKSFSSYDGVESFIEEMSRAEVNEYGHYDINKNK